MYVCMYVMYVCIHIIHETARKLSPKDTVLLILRTYFPVPYVLKNMQCYLQKLLILFSYWSVNIFTMTVYKSNIFKTLVQEPETHNQLQNIFWRISIYVPKVKRIVKIYFINLKWRLILTSVDITVNQRT